tara:strand:+ start:3175 stop:3828 length:654 start_codon:yes stop_codon:yes gene_type:complete
MDKLLETPILFAVFGLCVSYIVQYVSKDPIKNKEIHTTIDDNKNTNTVLENKQVYLDIAQQDYMTDDDRNYRIHIELFHDTVPKTAHNFYELCKNKKYSGVPFHRMINGFVMQGGDITHKNGMGGKSIYGSTFDDENFKINHDKEGLLSMANRGPNTNSSQFFITLGSAHHLDGKHVVFGRVTKGMEFIRNLSTSPVDYNDSPLQPIVINDCGILIS